MYNHDAAHDACRDACTCTQLEVRNIYAKQLIRISWFFEARNVRVFIVTTQGLLSDRSSLTRTGREVSCLNYTTLRVLREYMKYNMSNPHEKSVRIIWAAILSMLAGRISAQTFGSVRLVGGTNATGRVEVYNGVEWGTVCDDTWDKDGATVVCRQLGFSSGSTIRNNGLFGQGTGVIGLGSVICNGTERHLLECSTNNNWGINVCRHIEDAGVTCSECSAFEDIMFVLDASGSVKQSGFDTTLTFVQNVSSSLDISPTAVRVGVITFSYNSYPQFPLDRYNNASTLLEAIARIPYAKGSTLTHHAINYLHMTSFTKERGARTGARKIGIIITDGVSGNQSQTIKESIKAKAKNISLFAIAVGSDPHVREEMLKVVSEPSYFKYVTSYSELYKVKDNLIQKACMGFSIPTSSPTLTLNVTTSPFSSICDSQPCMNGGYCNVVIDSFSCVCLSGYSGFYCNITGTCKAEFTQGSKGNFSWPETKHLKTVMATCLYGGKPGTIGLATRTCFVTSDRKLDWGDPDDSNCKISETQAEETVAGLLIGTANPTTLTSESVASAATQVQEVVSQAINNPKIAQKMVNVVSQLIGANQSFLQSDDGESEQVSAKLVQAVLSFTEQVNLTGEVPLVLTTENLVLQAQDVPTLSNSSVEFSGSSNQKDVSISLPSTAFRAPCVSCNLTNIVRVSFILYRNSKLFSTENDSLYGPLEDRKVISASLKGRTVENLSEPIPYTLPTIKANLPHMCVYWVAKDRTWSSRGLALNYSDEQKIVCHSDHLTGFAVILAPNPQFPIPPDHAKALLYISYIGCGLSMLGLGITFVTYLMFRSLRRDKTGKILLNFCASMFFMNLSFILGTLKDSYNSLAVCTSVGVILHYFILTTLCWMSIEAVHMYRLLITVFISYESRFMIKRCLLAWGLPALIVSTTVAIDVEHYQSSDMADYCLLAKNQPYAYYITFFGPGCSLLLVNTVVFVLVSKVIFRRNTESISWSVKSGNNHAGDHTSRITVNQIRGAFTVMVLLGVTWLIGPLALYDAKLLFSYLFSILNSLQGFLVFLIRCALYKDARLGWMNLLRTGSLTMKKDSRLISSSANASSKPNKANHADCDVSKTVRTTVDDVLLVDEKRAFSPEIPGIEFIDAEESAKINTVDESTKL